MRGGDQVKDQVKQATEAEMLAAIERWAGIATTLDELKKTEMHLRKFIIAQTFPKLKEGMNTSIFDHIEIKVNHKVERKIDSAVLDVSKEKFRKVGIVVDGLVEYKPYLKTKAYRLLNKSQMKLFDTALTITDGSPQLDIIIGSPVKKKK